MTLADRTQAEKTCPAAFMKFLALLPLAGMPQELQSGARSPNEFTGILPPPKEPTSGSEVVGTNLLFLSMGAGYR